MPEQTRLEEIGFADFVAVLLVETLDSIIAAHTSQEERLRALNESVQMDEEVFAQAGISAEQVYAALVEIFPDPEGGTTVVAGGPAPDKEVLTELGITLPAGSVNQNGLTSTGVTAIENGIRRILAARQLEALREVARRGAPRLVVDRGTLRAKLTFSAQSTGSAPAPSPGPTPGPTPAPDPQRPTRPVRVPPGRLARRLTWVPPLRSGVLDSVRDVRLKVATPSAGGPGSSSSTQVYGEVEISFHTEG